MRVAFLGPPSAGKSAILDVLVTIEGLGEHANLDDDVLALCSERQLSGPLPDEIVDESVDRLLTRSARIQRVFVELPHHDYIELMQRRTLQLEDFDHVVIVTAPLAELLRRNRQRRFQVPDAYITRCYGAAAALAEHLRSTQASWMLLDSGLLAPPVMAELARVLVRQRGSRLLGQLEVAPIPTAPYLGGHLASDVEWSGELVEALLRRRRILTALDVGCGLGLTIDRFAALGVQCWGLEGNPRVLDGPCQHKQRLLIVDFQKQSVELPIKFDLVWSVEVLEHIPSEYEENVVRTITSNAQGLVFVSAAPPGQPGYFHVNCRPRSYWIDRFEAAGLRFVPETDELLRPLSDTGPFGMNAIKANGFLLEVRS